MTCQYCQTWIGDDDHRCPHCGRRVRATPAKVFPIASTATAHAYDFAVEEQRAQERPSPATPITQEPGQQRLFTQPVNSPRVVSLDSLKKKAQHKRDGQVQDRPAPIETGKVELRRARSSRKRVNPSQTSLDFFSPEVLVPSTPSIICDAPVAPIGLRIRAAMIDGTIMLAAAITVAILFRLCGGRLSMDRQVLLFSAVVLITVPLLYKILWAFSGRDTVGMQTAHLRLVDFDGNPPSQKHRYLRLFGSAISLLAAGIGLVWSLVDQDALTWHDHISETFPTLAGED
jgi:uncharacterized RDD family membrane protein YckC